MGIVKNEGKLLRVEKPVKNGDIVTVTYFLEHAPNAPFHQHFTPDRREAMDDVEQQAEAFYERLEASMQNLVGRIEERSLRGHLMAAGVNM